MASRDELINLLATQHPEFYETLRTRELPPGWQPDPTMTAKVLARMSRDECRTCEEAGAPILCAVCGVARYCSAECMRLDSVDHKQFCGLDHGIKATLKEMLYAGHPDDA